MNKLISTVAVASLVVWGSACGATNMTPTGPEVEPRKPGCEFRIFTTAPKGYAEIATIDVEPGGYGHNVFKELADLKEEIRPLVCQAGGDAAIAYANGNGVYIKATVLKRLDKNAPDEAPVDDGEDAADEGTDDEDEASAPVASKAPANLGCQYDTQCKGDRVCVKGECVDPPPAAAPSGAAPASSAAPPSP